MKNSLSGALNVVDFHELDQCFSFLEGFALIIYSMKKHVGKLRGFLLKLE